MEEINLKELFEYFLSKILIILIVCVVAIGGGFLYNNYLKVPMYESYTTIVLTMTSDSGVTTSEGITQNDITLNQKLVPTYREIIRSRRILNRVKESLQLDISVNELSNKIGVVNENDTELIKITVSDKNPINARNIANEITEVFKEEIINIYKIENINIIDYAEVDNKPYNINLVKEIIIFFLGGLVLSCAIVFIMFYFDTTIKSVEDIEEKIGLPALGRVPLWTKRGGKK